MSLEKPYADIPGTTIFDADMARKGHHLNQFCMSLMKQENRDEFNQHESLYLDRWPMSEEQKQAVLSRDYNAMIAEGGNIYYLAKIFSNDGLSFQQVAATMTGMSEHDYVQMMLNGGRNPQENFYLQEEIVNGSD
ncbi:MAG: protocatechuate 4,5-dioxygenase subunit alpha [Gammaproteobacteria bacterium]|nr:protocatechuate 4,5-dioxygenase subunit alpha [Gammaproteobacteria bacterium]